MTTRTERNVMPKRRSSETFDLEFGGMRTHTVTVGFYDDHLTPGDVFINSGKSGEQLEAIARDGAVLLSLALQHGVPLTTIGGAITRNETGEPSTLIGAIVDKLVKDYA